MTSILLKKFVKNYTDTSDNQVRESYGSLAGVVGIVVNILLFIAKFIAATLSGFAISVIGDALNNLFDAASSVVTFFGFKMANKEEDEDHPFGHGRIEYISALLVSLIIFVVGFELAKESVSKILSPQEISISIVSVVIMVVAILVKIWLGLFNRKLGNEINSSALRATATDSFCDVLATSCALIGLVVALFFGINIEGYTGTIVAGFIMYTAVMSVKETLSPLLGEAPDKEYVSAIEATVKKYPEVVGIHDLIVHDYGPGRKIVSLHAEVKADDDIFMLHDVIDTIEIELGEKFGCLATIHLDPLNLNCEVTNELKALLKQVLFDIDPALSFHDFRTVTGPTHTNLIFDVVVPHKYKTNHETLIQLIKNKVKEQNENYFCVITVEKSFV